jgi:hypothetical protein
VHANAKAGLGETQRGRATGDARTDNRDVDAAVVAAVRAWRDGIFEPVRIQDVVR